ncbi:hypothetical protein HPB47_011643, partial [Ixodes persulcatus]
MKNCRAGSAVTQRTSIFVRDKDHLIKWDKNKAAAPAYLLAIGFSTLAWRPNRPIPRTGHLGRTCLMSGVITDPKPCGFTHPRLDVGGIPIPVSGEKGILVVELNP